MGGNDLPSQKGFPEWLGYHDNGTPLAGVQDGPEVFAKLLNQSKEARYVYNNQALNLISLIDVQRLL